MSSKGWSVYFKSSLQIHYSWAWGTCLVPLLSLSCCGWWRASHTSVVSLMCSVLPCRGAKLSVLSRWHWMCCIAGRRYCARLWFSWKLSKQSWSSIVSQKAQPPFVGWWQVQSVHTLLWAAQGCLPMLRWGGGGSRVLGSTSLVLLCFPQATHFALHLRRGSILFCLLWESLTLWAPRRGDFPSPLAGCCWADTWGCKAVLASVPAPCSGVPGWSRPAHCTVSARKEARAAEAGKVLWGPGSPREPTISSILPSAYFSFSLSSLNCLRVPSLCNSCVFRGAESLSAKGRMGTGSARVCEQDFWLWG